MNELYSHPVREESIAAGHESDVANVYGLVFAIGCLASLAVIGVAIVWLLLMLFNATAERPEPAPQLQAKALPLLEPPLNPNQSQELHQLRIQEEKQLSSYQWVDQESGVAQIPIEQAMQILSERGLPNWDEDSQ